MSPKDVTLTSVQLAMIALYHLSAVGGCKQVAEQVNDVRKEERVGGPASGYESIEYHPTTIFQSVIVVFVVTAVAAALYFWCRRRGYWSHVTHGRTEIARQEQVVQYVSPHQEPVVRYEVVERTPEQPAQNVKAAPALRVYN